MIFYKFKFKRKDGFEEGDPIRYTKDSLLAIMAEIKILVQCQFVVCTFSSNVMRKLKIRSFPFFRLFHNLII